MWDKRIYRGNTYATQVLPMSAQAENELKKQKEQQQKRRKIEELRLQQLEQERANSMITPQPVEGRKHIEIQTDKYLEEVTDMVTECEAYTQTDPFMDRPESPIFLPAKSGIDVAVQIDEELFNFDFEVDPILEVLIGKTLEQSMLEVMQEEEMQNIAEAQRQFEQNRNERLAETQRLEAEERRRSEEKDRRKQQERERLQREYIVKEKLSSRTFAKNFLGNLEGHVFDTLERQGYFYDVVQREVETDFMPWLVEKVQELIESKKKSRVMVDELIKSTLRHMLIISNKAREEREKRELEEERLRKKEEERQKELKKQREEEERLRREEKLRQEELEKSVEDRQSDELPSEEENNDEDE